MYGLKAKQLINEVNIYSDESITIAVDGPGRTDNGYYNDPYIKVFNAGSRGKCTKKTRVSIFRNEYVIHRNERWDINSKEAKKLNKALDKKPTYSEFDDCETVRDAIVKFLSDNGNYTEKEIAKLKNDIDNIDFLETKGASK